MSSAKENSCRKFQANIFNKSKCQNCFKPRELHLLTDQDLNQAKPIYGGWLCLAPEGTDFDNPMQRSRKWQRRFFVLYEHGCLRFALDESPSTLPQGTVNMNLCTDVIDAEPRTGQKNALCIITPEQEYYIRGDNKEIINGWSEQLVVYPRTNKQNQKKKRKVEPATSQEPGPAKVAVTGSGIPDADKTPDSSSIIWQEELQSREADVSQTWSASEMSPLGSQLHSTGEGSMLSRCSDQSSVNGDEVDRSGLSFHSAVSQPSHDPLSPTGSSSSRHSGELGGIPRCLSPAPSDPFPSGSSLLSNGSHISGSMSSLDSEASGSTVTSSDSHPTEPIGRLHRPLPRRSDSEAHKAEKRSRLRSPERQDKDSVFSPERSGRSNVIEKLEALELDHAERMEVEETNRSGVRQGRSEMRRFQREEQKLDSGQSLDFHHSTLPPLRRAKSLDRRTTESVMTPDLLNFKKGWMVKLDEQGQWKKYWFVLTDHSLRYYKDSIAEEASDLDGEIDLSTCYNVTEYQAQRNYGFQIHTQEGVHTLSAMTAGIRRNWIQAVLKNVRPSTAPDVASLPGDHGSCGPFESLAQPDITQDSQSFEASSVERDNGIKKSRARERRREGRSKTFDWAEFRPIAQALAQQRAQEADTLQADLTNAERAKRREERRRRYESVTGSSIEPVSDVPKMDLASEGVVQVDAPPPSVECQQKMEDEIEQRWQQVEKTPIREEKRVPLSSSHHTRDTSELEKLVESYKKGVEELKAQLESCHQQLMDSNRHKLELESHLKDALEREQQIRAGYISPLESPLSLETEPLMKRTELVSSQAQSLTKKYQETKELLQLQEQKKRNMQAQLGLSLAHWPTKEPCLSDTKQTSTSEVFPSNSIQKTLSFTLLDSEGKIRELEDLIDVSKPLTLRELIELMHSHSEFVWVQSTRGQERKEHSRSGEMTQCQKLLENLKNQQEIENETMRKSLEMAGDCIRDYEARLVTMEDMLGKVQSQKMSPHSSVCSREDCSRDLSQRVELLANENVALNQRYQEIVNQLREADREIDRLKAEVCRIRCGRNVNQDMTEQVDEEATSTGKNVYERELGEKSQQLQQALIKLEVLGNNLKETEKRLQLKEATLRGLGFQVAGNDSHEKLSPETEELKHQIEVIQSTLSVKEQMLHNAEEICRELQAQNTELITKNEETTRMFSQMLVDAQKEIGMLKEQAGADVTFGMETETETESGQELTQKEKILAHDMIEEVVEEFNRKSKSLKNVLDVLVSGIEEMRKCDSSSVGIETNILDGDRIEMMKKLFEEKILHVVLGGLEESHKGSGGEQPLTAIKSVVERMLAENKLLLFMNKISEPQKTQSIVTCTEESTGTMKMNTFYHLFDDATNSCIMRNLANAIESKVVLLNHTASSIREPTNEQLRSSVLTLSNCETQARCWTDYVHEAILDVIFTYLVIQQSKVLEREMHLDVSAFVNCSDLKAQNMKLRSELEQKEVNASLQSSVSGDSMAGTRIHIEGEPVDSLDKAIQLQDLMAKHKKELRELKGAYEEEAEKLREEVAKAGETLRLRSEENVKEIDSLTVCMENLQKKHEMECSNLIAQFNREMEELTDAVGPDVAETGDDDKPTSTTLKLRIKKLVSQLSEEIDRRDQGDATLLRLKYEKDLENLKATCERGFAAMEVSHQKVIDELQKKHQRELEKLQDEKERLLAEETAATIAAIEAMKNAHRTELERELEKTRKANSNNENADIEEIRKQHEEELMSYQREIEVLSEQYSQKCLENAHLAQALEAERQALRQCQRENQELNAHNQELNNRLAAEITRMRSMTSEDDTGTGMHGKELYELEVMLRVKESEVQYLKQEINSLKDELQSAQRDKKYATDKYKDIYTELSIVRAKAERDVGRLREQLQQAHEALGEPSLEERSGYDIMKSKSNPDILKMAAAAAKRSERTMRSKSLKEGLTAEQRLHLFDNKDTKDF
ncbi:uncharacterized protein mprip isoform X1 [Paramisgurnus dabryanus]|uniref:uncharacterized protein mprip isoform X1 n=1 Tax=Paramisgurnus dabryanus TaxID=90735 RepID=UPI0031F419D0